ncbi:hypothetical protein [Pseudonocardia oroxyli]|uniref:hypothetical protein n=1 Tax=Pseudonocardia oroxyli TaxID=366584 RepID=UPI0015A24C76|nr:hypothetical protein [Pseudonocardia oroxyli]
MKLAHGTDARVQQHLAFPDCRVIQVVEASHVDITQAERNIADFAHLSLMPSGGT